MGLTIHYQFQSDSPDLDQARCIVEELHRAARGLPFADVGDVVDFAGDQTDGDHLGADDPMRWLLVQANHVLFRDDRAFVIPPLVGIAFSTFPGEGCEPANFGLCRYPATVEQHGETIPTGLDGWHWQSFCKTQYASDPREGGIKNFLRCHLTILRLLDRARDLGILASIEDEGGFWEHRDVAKLVKTIGQWNRSLAGFVGQFKDQFGGDFIAPIKDFPDFEHLEADDRREG